MRNERYFSSQGISNQKEANAFLANLPEGSLEFEDREEFEEMRAKFLDLMRRHFPTLASHYSPPSLEIIEANFYYIMNNLVGPSAHRSNNFNSREFLSTAAVRILDNFIDEVFWPEVVARADGQNKEKIYSSLQNFLTEAEEILRTYDPYMPPEIKELPLVELRLALTPDQKTFDAEVENYFGRKSFNLAYLRHLADRQQSQSEELWTQKERDRNQLLAAWDIGRDLMEENRDKSDFSLIKLIEDYHLNPAKLTDVYRTVLSRIVPKLYEYIKNQGVPENGNHESWGHIYDLIHQQPLSQQERFFVSCCLSTLGYLQEHPAASLKQEELSAPMDV